MLFTSMLYYGLNGFYFSTATYYVDVLDGYKTIIGTGTNNWNPATIVKYYGGLTVVMVALIFHVLGYYEKIPEIASLVVTYDLDYLAPAIAVLYLFFAYQAEE